MAERQGWNVVKVFSKQYSSSQAVRTDFDEIVSFIKKSKEPIHYYLFKSIDRFTRSGVQTYLQMKATLLALGVEVIDTYGIIQPEQNTLEHLGFSYKWSTYSPTEAAQILEAHRSNQEVRDILTRMIGAEIALVKDGYQVGPANDGYANKRIYVEGKKKMIQVPDPDRAHYFIEMFNLRAAGRLTDTEIVEHINSLGYLTKFQKRWNKTRDIVVGERKGKPLTVKQLQRFIQRPIYAGVICEKWTNNEPVQAQFDGLVSIDTFNRANKGKIYIQNQTDGSLKLLYDYHETLHIKRRLKNNPEYPYKNIVLCNHCEKPFLGSASRGKLGTYYAAYHCNRNGHYLRIPKPAFDDTVDGYLDSIALKPRYIHDLEHELLRMHEEQHDNLQTIEQHIQETVQTLKAEQAQLFDSFIATQNPVICEKIEQRVEELERKISHAEKRQETMDITKDDIRLSFQYAGKTMEHPQDMLKNNDNLHEQAVLASLIFEQLPTYEKILNGTPQLSPIFVLSEALQSGDYQSVTRLSLGWNTWREVVYQWIKEQKCNV